MKLSLKSIKKLFVGMVAAAALTLSTGLSDASAAYPVEATLSPAHVTYTASSQSVTKTLSWGGIYNVSYYDGFTTRSFSANYYSTTHTQSYSLGSNYSTYTWQNTLRVSNGTSDTVYGSVTLKRF